MKRDKCISKSTELSPLQRMYLELEEIIKPRLLDDFCGYNEETQSFDLVLAIKQIIQAKEQECEAQRCKIDYYIKKTTQLLDDMDKYKQALDEIEEFCKKQNLKYDATACYILGVIGEMKGVNNDR